MPMTLHWSPRSPFVRKVLASAGYKGKGVLDRGDLSADKALSEKYSFGFSFEIDNYLQGGPEGAFVLAPVVVGAAAGHGTGADLGGGAARFDAVPATPVQ